MFWMSNGSSLSIDGETTPSKNEYCTLTVSEGYKHNYCILLYKNRGSNRLIIYLALTSNNAKNIELFDSTYKTVREAKHGALLMIDKLEETNLSSKIEEWKKEHIMPVFNSDFEIVGDIYTSMWNRINNPELEYYNDNPVNELSGIYYTLVDKDRYYVENIGSICSSTTGGNNPEILEKMLNKLGDRYARFKNINFKS